MPTLFNWNYDQCYGTPNDSGLQGFPLKGVVPPTAFALLEERTVACSSTRSSGQRLQSLILSAEDGSEVRSGMFGWAALDETWYDSARDETCKFQLAADRVLRCLPSNAIGTTGYERVTDLFVDPDCTRRVAATDHRMREPQYAWLERTHVDACVVNHASYTSTVKVFEVGAAIRSDTVYGGSPGACVEAFARTGPPFYEVGREIPPSEFVAATLSNND
jgi:hypothetical protein